MLRADGADSESPVLKTKTQSFLTQGLSADLRGVTHLRLSAELNVNKTTDVGLRTSCQPPSIFRKRNNDPW